MSATGAAGMPDVDGTGVTAPRVDADYTVGARRASRRPDRQRQIRDAAVRLFDELGFRGTSMQDIADAVGIRPSALYKHVKSKQQLLSEIMLDDIQQLQQEFNDAIASSDDVVEQLRRATEAHVRHHARYAQESHIGIGQLPSLEEPTRTEFVNCRRQYARWWRELIERGMQQSAFHVSDTHVAASMIVDMGIGVSRWYREGGPLSDAMLAIHYGDAALRIVGVGVQTPSA